MTRGKQYHPGIVEPPPSSPTTFRFPVHPQAKPTAQSSEEGRTDKSIPHSYHFSIKGPDTVEIGQLVSFSLNSDPALPSETAVLWHVLKGPELSPHRVSHASIDYLIPATDEPQLLIAAEVRLPGLPFPPMVKEVAIRGTTLSTMIKSFQEIVSQGRSSPRFTRRLADHLYKAQQAKAEGDQARLSRSLYLIASDCATVLKKKTDPGAAALYHQARWLQGHSKKP